MDRYYRVRVIDEYNDNIVGEHWYMRQFEKEEYKGIYNLFINNK